jgi:NAD(P)-dependent dehydrogenase (short-subunit alcohol dehydrogenase family)
VLINNAGAGSIDALGPLADVSPATWWNEYEFNVKGTMLMTHGFPKLLGKDQKGVVVTMNNGLATILLPGLSAYGTVKLASLTLMEYLAVEYPNISAVSMQAGVVMTDAVLGW